MPISSSSQERLQIYVLSPRQRPQFSRRLIKGTGLSILVTVPIISGEKLNVPMVVRDGFTTRSEGLRMKTISTIYPLHPISRHPVLNLILLD